MLIKLKRVTLVVTPEMEKLMDEAKKMFYDHTQSDMIRTLIIAGLDSLNGGEINKQPQNPPDNCSI